MGLREYQRKRRFNRTPEPAAKLADSSGRRFVVQKHAASHLHYDFRLELDGVLKSWAVPKGPSLDPTVKRLAMQVEDHPVDYGAFEGIIPQGEYGGGTVMLWDQGQWEPVGDAHEGYRQGRLKFQLHGEKLRGGWMLVRTKSPDDRKRQQWLLFKERDQEARSKDQGDILEELPLSVSTGRNLEEIAANRNRVWRSHRSGNGKASYNGTTKPGRQAPAKAPSTVVRSLVAELTGVKESQRLPQRIDVQLATLAKEAPEGEQWLHEVKFDGYRMICRIDGGRIDLLTRNHKNWTENLPSLAQTLKRLPVKQAILDGEVVVVRPDGTTDFQDLQNAFSENRVNDLHYYFFDVLHLDGADLTGVPLEDRKRVLKSVVERYALPHVHYSEHFDGSGAAFLKQACKTHLEGIICKRRDQLYRPGRGYDWLKVKCIKTGEFVIGGYSEPSGARTGFGALLVGYHDRKKGLLYAGKVGTGFTDATLQLLRERLEPLERDASPFSNLKRGGRGTHWVAPELVAQVVFGNRTRDGRLRHAAFQGLREDKPATEVTVEKPVPLTQVARRAPGKSPPRATKIEKGSLADHHDYNARAETLAGVRLTSPDKVLYPEQGITKLELANYYRLVSDWILPHIADRPLVLVRCPEGREKECFYQKHPPAGMPKNLRQVRIRQSKKTAPYVVVDDVGGLISLAQVGALEIHAWGSRVDHLEKPDRLIFDLDPDPTVPWRRVVDSARQVRDFLKELGLESFVKTTGGKGLHLVVPIQRRHDWDQVKEFCKQVADLIVAADPAHYTANMSKAARPGKIFLDYLRNGRGATAIVAYSTRARPNAPVSVPLTWQELTPGIRSDQFTIRNIAHRLASLRQDPWEGIDQVRQGLAGPMKKLRALSGQ